jgi:dTMP kinase
MPIEISQKLLTNRYGGNETKKDIHEVDIEYLKSCRKSAMYSAEKFNWEVIPCSEGGNVRTVESIAEDIFKVVERVVL